MWIFISCSYIILLEERANKEKLIVYSVFTEIPLLLLFLFGLRQLGTDCFSHSFYTVTTSIIPIKTGLETY